MKIGWLLIILFLSGCAARYQAGVGYELANDTLFYQGEPEDVWQNPVGIVGVAYPLTDHVILDYRHISSLGGPDRITSDAVSLLFEFRGGDLIGRGRE